MEAHRTGGVPPQSEVRYVSMKAYLTSAFGVLPASSRRRLGLIVLLLALVSILDLVALAMVLGVTAVAAAAGRGNGELPDGVLPDVLQRALGAIGAESAVEVTVVLGLCVILLFVAKSVLACAVLRRALLHLAHQEALLVQQLMSTLMRAPLTFHLQLRNADIITDITRGTGALIINGVAPVLLAAAEVLLIVVIAAGLLVLTPALALAAMAYFGVTFMVMNRLVARRARIAGQAEAEAARRGLSLLQWALGGYREVTVRGAGDFFVQSYSQASRIGAASRAEVAYLAVLPRYYLESALVLGLAVVFAVQVPLVGYGGALSGLALFAVAGFRLLPSLNRLQASAAAITSAKPFGERALVLLRQAKDAPVRPDTRRPVPSQERVVRRGIELVDVSFSYPGTDGVLALKGVSLLVPAGGMTAVVGSSGSGKSTLVDVLLGLLPPTSGRVLVDGAELEEQREHWLTTVGYVPQDVFLMPTSVRSNVALGLRDDEVDDEAVWDALRRAALDTTIAALPGQLDYPLGDAGSGISGGQRQRLGIARALYTRPSVLVLDEATSALDVETEAAITETLSHIPGLTKVVVAHRLSTVKDADQVVFLRHGEVVTVGTFAEVSRDVPDFARQVRLSGLTETSA